MSNSHSKRPRFFELFPFSFRDLKITLLILLVAVTFCILLQRMEPSAGFSMPVFVLTVLLTSWLTNGYFWGLLSAVLGVIAVNYFYIPVLVLQPDHHRLPAVLSDLSFRFHHHFHADHKDPPAG